MIKNCKVSKHSFKEWCGQLIADTYGGKTVVDFKGQPLFAELVALHFYKEMGFDGVWVDNYRNKYRVGLPEIASPIQLPAEIEAKLSQILRINNSRKGIWDLLLWQNRKLKFVELKRKGKDAIRDSQIQFLNSALQCGYQLNQFEIIEWEIVSNC